MASKSSLVPLGECASNRSTNRNLDEQIALPSVEDGVTWLAVMELGYVVDDDNDEDNNNDNDIVADASNLTLCCSCQKSPSSTEGLKKCAICRVAAYCSKECQTSDWKRHKKQVCAAYQRLHRVPTVSFATNEIDTDAANNEDKKRTQTPRTTTRYTMALRSLADKEAVRTELFGKLRFYACPYAVHQTRTLGRGFLFLQSTGTLAIMSLGAPQDWRGRPLQRKRSLVLHFLTLGEFDVEVCREDFELASLRPQLQQAVNSYDSETQVVLLMRFRCGHYAVGLAQLVPQYHVCVKLGQDYFAQTGTDPLQLDIDDV